MNLGEVAKLIIQLDLKGNAAAAIKNVRQEVTKLDQATSGKLSSGFKNLGAGLTVAFVRAGVIAVGAIGGIITAVGVMAKEGQAAANVQTIYAQSIKNSGLVSEQYVKILNDQQIALMNLSGADNELIKAEQTKLIQMGLTGKQVAEITPLILDFAEATGLDLLTATTLVGKSVEGNTGALSRYGVVVDRAKAKSDPFAATQDAISKAFKGTTAALSGGLDVKLKVFNEGIKNIREEAGIRLLPALTHLVDVAGRKLVPAFGKFVDKIIPALIKGMGDLADIIESGGVERGINTITDAIGPMVKVLQMAVGPVKAIVSTFLRLPQKVQAALISGFIINKLGGGLPAKGASQIVGAAGSLAGPALGTLVGTVLGKLGFTRGGSPATPLFVMDVQNRLPNGQFAAGFTKQTTLLGKIANVAGKVFLIGAAVGVFAELKGILDEQSAQNQATVTGQNKQLADFIALGNKAALEQSFRGLSETYTRLMNEQSAEGFAFRNNIDGVRTAVGNEMRTLQAAILALPAGIARSISSMGFGGKAPPKKPGRHPVVDDTGGGSQSGVTHGGGNAVGAFGLTRGFTPLGYAGEAGREAVAIIRNPRPIMSVPSSKITVNANVSVSTRDVNSAQNIKRRYGPTPTQAGAA